MGAVDIIKFIIATIIPIALCVGCVFLEKWSKFSGISKRKQQIIFGVLFGISSISGTLLGSKIPSGPIINVRDASPIICGLMFGGPSGIIAGLIGGLFRVFTPFWDIATAYTVVACSVSTALAGVFTALVRHFFFNDNRGTWYYGFFLGVLVEDFHMMMTMITHANDIVYVYQNVIKLVTLPMVLANAIAVMVALILVDIINKDKLIVIEKKRKVATKVQLTLLAALLISYAGTSVFSNISIKNVVKKSLEKEAMQAIDDVKGEVDNKVNNFVSGKLLEAAKFFENPADFTNENMYACRDAIGVSDVHIIGDDGRIKYSTIPWLLEEDGGLGFDMGLGGQSAEFNQLLNAEVGTCIVQEYEATSSDENTYMKYAGVKLDDFGSENINYLQVGLNTDLYYSLLSEEVEGCAEFRHIKEEGFVVVSDSFGNVISTLLENKMTTIDVSKAQKGKYDNYYTFVDYSEGYYIVSFADKTESDLPAEIGFAAISLAEIFVFLLLYCALYIAIKRIVVDKIVNVSSGLKKISDGDLNVKINERNTFELASLSTDINKTVNTLKSFIEKEANKNAEELQFAKSIQYSVLPNNFPLNDRFEIYAQMNAAKTVGGDFYDFFYIDREHVLIEIADVSGKGIPAAMFMMRAKSLLKSLLEQGVDIEDAFIQANDKLCKGNDTQTFITVWGGVIDLTTGHVDFINAGHNPPLVCRDGKFEYLRSKPGFVLAGIDGFKYQKQSFDIKKGDILYLYTDGVTEANNEKQELYGEDRLLKAVDGGDYTAKSLCQTITRSVKGFVKDAEQSDDITMLAFKLYDVESATTKIVDAQIEKLPEIMEFVDSLLEKNGATTAAKSQIDVAVDEIFSNIAFYGYSKDRQGKAKISVIMSKDNTEMTLIFEDKGKPFNPLEKADPDTSLSLEEKSIGGLGIFIVKKTMDKVDYVNENGHNILTIVKKIK